MSRVKKNLLTQGLSGMIGRTLVFRRVGNETLVSSAPSTGREPSPEQQTQRNRFRKAASYAKAQMTSSLMKRAYAQSVKGRNMLTAYNAAVMDYMISPEITEIDLAHYAGHTNDAIRIKAIDDFRVASVTVTISDASGVLIESGSAVMQVNGLEWVYTVSVNVSTLAGEKITVTATDLPGNTTVRETTL